jgi:hypothetical protein
LSFNEKQGFFFPKNLFNHSFKESMNLHKTGSLSVHPHFSTIWTVLARPRNSFRPTEASSHFAPTDTSSHGNIRLVLSRSRNWSTLHEGPRRHFLRDNRDVFAWQHVNSHGPPKESTKLSARFISSLLIDLQSLTHTSSNTLFTSSQLVLRVVYWGASLPHFQYYSVYWLSTSTTCSLLKGYRSILPVLLHLLVLN